MGVYQYTYIDAKSKRRRNSIDAASIEEAKEKLRTQKILFTTLKEGKKRRFFFNQQRKETLITFTTQLAQLLGAGLPLYDSLLSLEEQYREDPFHPIITSLCEQINGGGSLSVGMECFPETFDPLYCAMIKAGESVGALEHILEKLAQLMRKQSKLKKQLTTALLYPMILMGFSAVVLFLLLICVIPSLELLFEDRSVNGFTACVMAVSRFLTQGWPLYLPALALMIGGGWYLANQPAWKQQWQRIKLRIPLVKTVIIQTAVARFTRTMGTLLEGGVTLIQALQLSRKVMRHPLLEQSMKDAEIKIIEGNLLSQELKKSPYIPTLVYRMLAIGEESGTTPLMLNKIATIYEDEVEKTLTRTTTLAQPVVLVIMGGIIGLIMLAVLLPLTDVNAFL